MKKIIGAVAVSTALLLAPQSAGAQDAGHYCPESDPAMVFALCHNPDDPRITCLAWVYVGEMHGTPATGNDLRYCLWFNHN